MSDSTPPGPFDDQPHGSPSEGMEEAGQDTRPKRRKGLVAGVAAGLVAVVGLPLGGFAVWNMLSGGGPQPQDVLPANAIAFFRVDVDPSAGQKIDAVRFMNKFPSFGEATGIDDPQEDIRKAIFEEIKPDDCDLDFEQDVDPWLGDRFGLAVMPQTDGSDEPGAVFAVQVQDEDKALEGVQQLVECGEQGSADAVSDAGGYTYRDGYLLVAETQELADRYAKAGAEQPLSENPAFTRDMDRLGEQGVASLWFDGAELAAYGDEFSGRFGQAGAVDDEQTQRAIKSSFNTGAVAFRFDADYAEAAMVISGDAYEPVDDAGAVSVDLPESTAVALGVADGAKLVDKHWDTLLDMAAKESGEDPQQALDQLEAAYDITLPDDLKTLLGDSFLLAFDAGNIDEVTQSGNVLDSRLGARIVTDTDDFKTLVQTVEQLAADSGAPIQLPVSETDDGAVVATNPEYAEELAGGGDLADSDAFRQAVADADDAQSLLYVNFDRFDSLAQQYGGDDPEFWDNWQVLKAFGASSTIEDGYAQVTMRLTAD